LLRLSQEQRPGAIEGALTAERIGQTSGDLAGMADTVRQLRGWNFNNTGSHVSSPPRRPASAPLQPSRDSQIRTPNRLRCKGMFL
jgi:hypothetical protein